MSESVAVPAPMSESAPSLFLSRFPSLSHLPENPPVNLNDRRNTSISMSFNGLMNTGIKNELDIKDDYWQEVDFLPDSVPDYLPEFVHEYWGNCSPGWRPRRFSEVWKRQETLPWRGFCQEFINPKFTSGAWSMWPRGWARWRACSWTHSAQIKDCIELISEALSVFHVPQNLDNTDTLLLDLHLFIVYLCFFLCVCFSLWSSQRSVYCPCFLYSFVLQFVKVFSFIYTWSSVHAIRKHHSLTYYILHREV